MRAAGEARQPDDRAARPHVPVRREEARERGHEVDAAGVGHARGDRLGLGGGADQAEVVAEPLDGRARDGDGSFEGVGALAGGAGAGRRREKPRGAVRRRRADVLEQERSGPVGVLGFSRREAALSRRAPPAGRRGRRRRERVRRTGRRRTCGRTARARSTGGSPAALSAARRSVRSGPDPNRGSRGCRGACATRSSDRSRARRPAGLRSGSRSPRCRSSRSGAARSRASCRQRGT